MTPHRGRFLAIRCALVLVAVAALLYAALHAGDPRPSRSGSPNEPLSSIPERDWGHVRANDGQLTFLLGPITDQRHRYELPLGRVVLSSARLAVADDEHGKSLVELTGEVSGPGGCMLHFQGAGVNVLIAVGKCVPSWAVIDGATAQQWIRVDNTAPRARVVLLRFPPL